MRCLTRDESLRLRDAAPAVAGAHLPEPPPSAAPSAPVAPGVPAPAGSEPSPKSAPDGTASTPAVPAPAPDSNAGKEAPAFTVEFGKLAVDSGALPDAMKNLRKARDRLAGCAKAGGVSSDGGEVELRFLVQGRGRVEGVNVQKRRGVTRRARQMHRGRGRSPLRRVSRRAGGRRDPRRDDEEKVTESNIAEAPSPRDAGARAGGPYAERVERFEALAERLGRTSRLASNLRGLSFGAAVIALIAASLGGQPSALPVAVVAAIAFIGFVLWHSRVIAAEDDALRMARVNLDARARVTSTPPQNKPRQVAVRVPASLRWLRRP